MNSMERVFNVMEGKSVDRYANMCLVMAFAAKQIQVNYCKYVTDYRELAKGAIYCHENFGIDMLCAISDPYREAEGFGAKVVIEEDDVPSCHDKLLKSIQDISRLKPVAPESSARMNDRLCAVSYLKEYSKGTVPVVGWVEGAIAESCDLFDISEFMMSLCDEPEAVIELLEICTEQSILFARAQIEAGADMIGIGDAASSLIGPGLYAEFALPYQQKLIRAIHDKGAKVKLHICGNIEPVLSLVAKTGADIVDLDHMVSLQKASVLLPETTVICGNIDPVSILLQGSTKQIKEAVAQCSQIVTPHRHILAAGCEVPKFTEVKKMEAFMQACMM